MQQIQLIGFIGRDAKAEQKDGHYNIHFSVAVTETYKKNDEKVGKTTWYSVFKYSKNDPAKRLEYLKTGAKVFVQGRPSYKIDQTAQGIQMNVMVNAETVEIVQFKSEGD